MPKATDIFCLHCQQYISRTRERAHRQKYNAPFVSPPPCIPSKLRRVFDVDTEDCGDVQSTQLDRVDIALTGKMLDLRMWANL
jgi:hypothetical protein